MFSTNLICDMSYAWQIGFQDSASPAIDGIVSLHSEIIFYLIIVSVLVFWVLTAVIVMFNNKDAGITHKYATHGTFIELVWTITPALVLVAIAFPSFQLLYIMDEVISPSLTIKVTGHQWYWSFEYSDFVNEEGESIEFDSYLMPESDLEIGDYRLLDVDNKVVLPADTHVRFIVTGADVIHDFAVPALGIKIDAYPGRLNQISSIIARQGRFYGQCSEICGAFHAFMPIVIEVVDLNGFIPWLDDIIPIGFMAVFLFKFNNIKKFVLSLFNLLHFFSFDILRLFFYLLFLLPVLFNLAILAFCLIMNVSMHDFLYNYLILDMDINTAGYVNTLYTGSNDTGVISPEVPLYLEFNGSDKDTNIAIGDDDDDDPWANYNRIHGNHAFGPINPVIINPAAVNPVLPTVIPVGTVNPVVPTDITLGTVNPAVPVDSTPGTVDTTNPADNTPENVNPINPVNNTPENVDPINTGEKTS